MSMFQLCLDAKDAWLGLRRRPLRSLLSSFGIGIGVAALVAMLSISEGAKQKTLAKIISLGTNTLRIEDSLDMVRRENASAVNLSSGLTMNDVKTLQAWLGDKGVIGAYIRKDNVSVSSGSRSTTGTVLAVSNTWYLAEKLKFAWGRPHNSADENLYNRVGVVGNDLANKLQLKNMEMVRVDNFPVKVIGQLLPKGHLLTEGTGLSSLDFDNIIILPLAGAHFVREIGGRKRLDGIVVALKSNEEAAVFNVAGQLNRILLKEHHQIHDYRMVIPLNLLREARENQRLFSLVMGSIAGLSLLVGGIGVMNVMLANISEQTREIGLRMAVGATGIRVVNLYLWNSILLTGAGAIWGIGGGMLLAALIQKYAGWDTAFSYLSLMIAPVSAILTGLLFGLHPAIRAASLDPAEALRDS